MKKLLSIIPLIIFYSNFSYADFDPRFCDYSKVDSIVEVDFLNIEYKTTTQLANDINLRFEKQHEKFRAIYKWIISSIEYDLNYYGKEPDKILNEKKAVCEGYSSLLLDLCKKTDIECEFVTGYCHNNAYSFEPLPSESDHAWNIITIENKKYFTDITWATSAFDSENGVYVKEFNETYFLVNPEQFSIDHFPDNSNYQLLKKKIKKNDFENYPNSGNGVRKFELYNISSQTKIINCKLNEKVYFKFSTNKKVNDVDFYIESETEYELIPILFEQIENDFSFYWEFENKGTFTISIEINKVETLYYKAIVN